MTSAQSSVRGVPWTHRAALALLGGLSAWAAGLGSILDPVIYRADLIRKQDVRAQ